MSRGNECRPIIRDDADRQLAGGYTPSSPEVPQVEMLRAGSDRNYFYSKTSEIDVSDCRYGR